MIARKKFIVFVLIIQKKFSQLKFSEFWDTGNAKDPSSAREMNSDKAWTDFNWNEFKYIAKTFNLIAAQSSSLNHLERKKFDRSESL